MEKTIEKWEQEVLQLQKQVKELETWKAESLQVWKVVLYFMYDNATDLRPGQRISEKVIEILAKHYKK